ncbi:MAG: retropepsin-like aspartic protease [Chitinophagales bacterium]
MNIKLKIRRIPPGGSLLFVNGKIEGKKINCLIDTGASKTFIDKNYMAEFHPGIEVKKLRQTITGIGANYDKGERTELKGFEIGKFRIKKMQPSLLDLSHVNKAYTTAGIAKIQMIIGGEILYKYKGVIDYAGKLLKLSGRQSTQRTSQH